MAIAGTYRVTVKTPVGPQQGVLTLEVDGDSVSGTLATAKGDSAFSGGTVSGKDVHFMAKIRTPLGRLKAEISGRVSGDLFSGTAKLPLGTGQIEGVRMVASAEACK